MNSGGVFVEQPCQQLNYTYDSGTGANLWGRVAKITSKSCEPYYLDEYSETFSYLSSGLLDYRDSRWVRTINPATTRTLRVQPTWNSYGQMTGYAYGAIGSLYSYTMSYDNAWRPAGLTGEGGISLVNSVGYNPAGGITNFVRDDGTNLFTNTYDYNSLYQMTMQKVVQGTSTTLQELNYTFSADKNNGQITSQTDALSGETIAYKYDELNRLIKAETTGVGGWGLSWTYDGFGNREQQTNLGIRYQVFLCLNSPRTFFTLAQQEIAKSGADSPVVASETAHHPTRSRPPANSPKSPQTQQPKPLPAHPEAQYPQPEARFRPTARYNQPEPTLRPARPLHRLGPP